MGMRQKIVFFILAVAFSLQVYSQDKNYLDKIILSLPQESLELQDVLKSSGADLSGQDGAVKNIIKAFIAISSLDKDHKKDARQILRRYYKLLDTHDFEVPLAEIPHWDHQTYMTLLEMEVERLQKSQGIKVLSLPASDMNSEEYWKIADQQVQKIIENIENKMKNLGTLLFDKQVGESSNHFKDIISSFFDSYYSYYPKSWVGSLLLDIVSLGKTQLSLRDLVTILFQNSGPVCGKMIQMFARDKRFPSELSELMKIVEDSNKPVPRALVEAVMKSDLGGYDFAQLGEKQFIGTVAYTQEAYFSNGQKVAVRGIKPNLEGKFLEELGFLDDVLRDIGQAYSNMQQGESLDMGKIVSMVEQLIEEDLDINKAINNHIDIEAKYTDKILVETQGIDHIIFRMPYYMKAPKGELSKLQVSEFIENGEKLSRYLENHGSEKASLISQKLNLFWHDKAIIDPLRKFHADLHQGNFTVVSKGRDIEVIFFDSGLVGEISRESIKNFVGLFMAVHFHSYKLLAKSLNGALKNPFAEDSLEYKKLIPKLKAQYMQRAQSVELGLAQSQMKIADWIGWLVTAGYDVDESMNKLARGQVMLTQLTMATGGEKLKLETQKKLGKMVMRNVPGKLSYLIAGVMKNMVTIISEKCSNLFKRNKAIE